MRLRTLLLAEHASQDSSGKVYVHGGGITRIGAHLPTKLPFVTLLGQWLVEDDDLGREIPIRITITNPSGDVLGQPLEQTIGPLVKKGELFEDQTMTVAIAMGGMPLESAGRYEFEIVLGEEQASTLGVAVIAEQAHEAPRGEQPADNE